MLSNTSLERTSQRILILSARLLKLATHSNSNCNENQHRNQLEGECDLTVYSFEPGSPVITSLCVGSSGGLIPGYRQFPV